MSTPAAAPDAQAWREARSWLRELRETSTADGAYTQQLTLSLFRLPVGPSLRARGAVAVHPLTARHPGALRMILLGPGGTTAFDLWICGDDYKLAIPAIDLERRGRASEAEEALPVSFLRWWFLHPLDGKLLAADEERLMVRDAEGIFEVRRAAGTRSDPISVERAGQRLTIERTACGRARYERLGVLNIDIACDAIGDAPPSKAFADPDDGRACGDAL